MTHNLKDSMSDPEDISAKKDWTGFDQDQVTWSILRVDGGVGINGYVKLTLNDDIMNALLQIIILKRRKYTYNKILWERVYKNSDKVWRSVSDSE